MPYTPPAQRSPATSQPNSPAISRQSSYADHTDLATASSNGPAARPQLPRSVSSTAYLQKHRRSPSLADSKAQAEQGVKHDSFFRAEHEPVHQVLSNMLKAEAEAQANSDSSSDEERGRRPAQITMEDIQKLEEALAKLQGPRFRGHSPTRDPERDATDASPSAPSSSAAALVPALSAAARNIIHARSSSEVQLSSKNGCLNNSNIAAVSSDESDGEEEGLQIKPPLLRKKSGELVKPALRPMSHRRPSSMPGTPTYSKAVHFKEDMEQVRHFLQVDKPSAVSATSSPAGMYESDSEYPFGGEYSRQKSTVVEWDIKTSNFPADSFERKSLPVRVDRIFLTQDSKTLVGTVAVANIAFHKTVVARFTLDYWKTTSEVVAEYNHDVRKSAPTDGMDRFNFNIKLVDQANLENKTLLLCVRYNANGQEFWDNNSNMNYQVDFIKKSKPKPLVKSGAGNGTSGSLGSVPRSRHSPQVHGRNARTQPASPDDDFSHRFDPTYQFGVGRVDLDTNPAPIRLKAQRQPRTGSVFPEDARSSTATSAAQSSALSSRYDFSASLSAALTHAQNALGDKSGIKSKAKTLVFTNDAPAVPTAPVAASASAAAPSTTTMPTKVSDSEVAKPAVLTTTTDGRPALQSAEYNDLIQKYCFFGADANTKSNTSATGTPDRVPQPTTSAPVSGQEESTNKDAQPYSSATSSVDSSAVSSAQSSGSNSPTPPPSMNGAFLDGPNDSRRHSRTPSTYSNLSQSSSNFSISARAGSPVPFQSPWGQGGQMGGSLFGEAQGIVASHG